MRDSRLRTAAQLTVANPASLVYLGLVVAAALPLVYASMGGDPGFAGIWLLLATAPTSPALLFLDVTGGVDGPSAAYFLGVVTFAALLHSFALGIAYRGIRRNMAPRATAHA